MKLGDLPIGALVRDAVFEGAFLVAAQNHPTYPGATTLFSQKVIGVRCLDAAEPEKPSRPAFEWEARFGSNDYAASNLHRWLNADQAAWFEPAHKYDRPPSAGFLRYGEQPYDDTPGFLASLSGATRKRLVESAVPVVRRGGKDRGELATVQAKVFLPSRTELGKGDESGMAEGAPLPLLYDARIYKTAPLASELKKHGRSWNPGRETAPDDAPQIYDPKYGWWYWMRTPSCKYSFLTRVASPYGAVGYTYANNDVVGVRPLMNLDADTEVEGDGKIEETFIIL